MKKLLVLFIASSLAFVSCSKDEINDDLNHKEVKANDLPGSSWTVKHIKVHKANLDGTNLTDKEKTVLEGLIKMSGEKLVLQEADKMYFKLNDHELKGTWKVNSEKDKWDIVFENDKNLTFANKAILEIKKGRLYFTLEGMDYTINGKHYVIEKVEFEMVKHV